MSAVSSTSSPAATGTGMGESAEVASFKQRLQALEQAHPKLEENAFFEELFKDASRCFDSELGSRAKLTTPSEKQQRLANILGLAEFFFQASHAAASWLEEAYTARVGDSGVEILLKILRCVPVSVSEIVRQATKGKDSRFRAQVVELCALKAPVAAFGRRCGDVPTMNHTLDLVFHLNKLKLSMERTGHEGLDAVVGAWIAQFQGQQAPAAQDSELERRFLGCTTPQEFKDLTVEMIKTAEFEKDGEATMNLVLLGAEADSQHAPLQGFGSHLGIGRFGCSVYFTFPQQEQCLMDVAFWNLSRAVVSVCDAGGVQIELTAKANADTSEAVSKAAGGAVRAGKDEYTLRFRVSSPPEAVDELQNTIDRRRFRFIKGAGESRVSKVSKPLMNLAMGKAQPKVASPLVFRKREELATRDSPKPVAVVVPQVERDELPNTDITEVEDVDSQLGGDGGNGNSKAFVSKRKVDAKPLAVALVRSGLGPLDMAAMTIADLFSLTKNYHAHLLASFFNIGGKLKSGRNKKLLIEALREDGESKPVGKKARLSATKPKTRVVQSDDEDEHKDEPKPTFAAKKRKAASPRPRQPAAEQLSPGDEPSFGDEFDFLTSDNRSAAVVAAPVEKKRNTRLADKVLPSLEQDEAYYYEEEESRKRPRRDQESSLPDPPQSPSRPSLSPTAPLERFVAAVARTPPAAPKQQQQQHGSRTTPTTGGGGGTQKTLVFASQEESEDSDDLLLVPAPRVLNFKSATLATERVTGLSPSPAFASTPSPLMQPLVQPAAAAAAVLPQPDFDLLSPPAVAPVSAPKRAVPRLAEISPLPPVALVKAVAATTVATTTSTSLAKKPKPVAVAAAAAAATAFKDEDDDSAVSAPSSDGEQDDFETEEIQNDAVLECRSAIASIHRAIQKVTSRRNRQDKRNDKLFRHTMHQGGELVAAIHRAEKRFLDQVDAYELLVAQRQARVQARALAVAQRHQYLQQLKRDAERVKRDIARHQAELQQALQQAAQSLAQSSKRQLGDIQKLLVKQKKDAKEWKPPVAAAAVASRNGSSL